MFFKHRALLEALEPFLVAGGEEAPAAAGAYFEEAQRSIDEAAPAVAGRHRGRPTARRVRKGGALGASEP